MPNHVNQIISSLTKWWNHWSMESMLIPSSTQENLHFIAQSWERVFSHQYSGKTANEVQPHPIPSLQISSRPYANNLFFLWSRVARAE